MADDAGSLLVRSGLISDAELAGARARMSKDGGTIAEWLVTGGAVADDELTEFYRSRLLVPIIHPETLAQLPAEVIAAVPADVAEELRAIPVRYDNNGALVVAMSDPSDRHAIDELAFFVGSYVVPCAATQGQIAWCLARYYGVTTPLGARIGDAGQVIAPAATPAPAPAPAAPTPVAKAAAVAPTPERPPVVRTRPRPATLPELVARTGETETRNQDRSVDAEPTIVIAFAEEDTGPARPGARSRHVSGEFTAARPGAPDVTPAEIAAREPQVVVALPALPDDQVVERALNDATDRADPRDDSGLWPRDAGDPARASLADDDAPILLTPKPRTVATPSPGVPLPITDEPSDVVVLEAPKPSSAHGRRDRITDVGLGVVGGPTRGPRDTLVDASPPPPMPIDDLIDTTVDRDGRALAGTPSVVANLPRVSRVMFDAVDEGWGAPGDTIPPSFSGRVEPVATSADESRPIELAPLAQASQRKATADPLFAELAADPARATERLVALVRALDYASSRDEIVDALCDHLAVTYRHAAFLVVKNGGLHLFRVRPNRSPFPVPLDLRLSGALTEVVHTRTPFRGDVDDRASREFLTTALTMAPGEVLVIPIAIKDRVVGVLVGETRVGKTYDEHIAIAARAAGLGLERILRTRS